MSNLNRSVKLPDGVLTIIDGHFKKVDVQKGSSVRVLYQIRTEFGDDFVTQMYEPSHMNTQNSAVFFNLIFESSLYGWFGGSLEYRVQVHGNRITFVRDGNVVKSLDYHDFQEIDATEFLLPRTVVHIGAIKHHYDTEIKLVRPISEAMSDHDAYTAEIVNSNISVLHLDNNTIPIRSDMWWVAEKRGEKYFLLA